ncbi:MAG: acyl carrier protein [Geminicoccaceae bacterium]
MTSMNAATIAADELYLAAWIEQTATTMLRLPSDVDVSNHSLASLGLNSLNALALQYRLQTEHGIEVTVGDLLGDLAISELADLLQRRASISSTPLETVR